MFFFATVAIILIVFAIFFYIHRIDQERRLVQEQLQRTIQERQKTEAILIEAKQQAELASLSKSQFLANMSHELRTPINAIIGYSEILMEEAQELGDSHYLLDLKNIHTAGQHLLVLISDILDLSKIEAGKMDLCLETYDIEEMVVDLISLMNHLIHKNNNQFTVHYPPKLGMMFADLTKVRQCLFNLLSNASKFTKQGYIALYVTRETVDGVNWVIFRVCDSGIGLTAAYQEELFMPFTQADVSTTRQYGGTGLGLAITKKFCEMMGGEIRVESEWGLGSTFIIRLPATVISAPAQPQQLLLIIDADFSRRDFYCRIFIQQGFQVIVAAEAQEGLRLAQQRNPQVILLDLFMPHAQGWLVLAALKGDNQPANRQIFLISLLQYNNLGFLLVSQKPLIDSNHQYNIAPKNSNFQIDFDSQSSFSPLGLLIADDIAESGLIHTLLEQSGSTVLIMNSQQNAIKYLERHSPNFVLFAFNLLFPINQQLTKLKQLQEQMAVDSTMPLIVVIPQELELNTMDYLHEFDGIAAIFSQGVYTQDELQAQINGLVYAVVGNNG